jgi:hypothetical protein
VKERDLIGRPQGRRSKYVSGEPVHHRTKFADKDAVPSSTIADAQSRGRFATGPARLRVEWALLKKAGRDKPRNVRIRPEDMIGRREG